MYEMDNQEKETQNNTALALSIGAVVVLVAALLAFLWAGGPEEGGSALLSPAVRAEREQQTSADGTGGGGQGQAEGMGQAAAGSGEAAAADRAADSPEDTEAAGTGDPGAGVISGAGGAPAQEPAAGAAAAQDAGGTDPQGANEAQAVADLRGGSAGQEEPVQVRNVSLTGDRTFLLQCEAMQLRASIDPPNAADPSLTWRSSNEEVARVTQSGLVTGVGGGDAIIRAYASNGVFVDYPLSVSSTQKRMKLTIRTIRSETGRAGDKWAYSFEINGKTVTGDEEMTVTLGETMTFYSAASEYLTNHDLATVDGTYTVSRDSLKNGFEVTQDFGVEKSGEDAAGGRADVTVIFTFSNAR